MQTNEKHQRSLTALRGMLLLVCVCLCGCPAGSGLPFFDGLFEDGATVAVSFDPDGNLPLGGGESPSLSANGLFVAFTIYNVDLISTEVFVRNLQTDAIERVSIATDGTVGNRGGESPSISENGRYVAFASSSSNLVANDNNQVDDVFVHDRELGTTVRVSVDSNGAEARLGGFSPTISADGMKIAFASRSDDLVPNDTNDEVDIFVHDLMTGMTERVSVDSNGNEQDTGGMNSQRGISAISGNGRYVAFSSDAASLVTGDTNEAFDVFVHDLETGDTVRVSIDSDGNQLAESSVRFAISADGRFVAFISGNAIFIHDRDADDDGEFDEDCDGCRETTMIDDSSLPEGASVAFRAVAISGDGRFVAFEREVSGPLPPPDESDTFDDSDVFIFDRTTEAFERVSVDTPGLRVEVTRPFDGGEITLDITNNTGSPSLSQDGGTIAFDGDLAFSFSGNTRHVFVETR